MSTLTAVEPKTRTSVRPYLPGLATRMDSWAVPTVPPLAHRALRLMHECDRVDRMPEGPSRDDAMDWLHRRVKQFEQESLLDQCEAMVEATGMIG